MWTIYTTINYSNGGRYEVDSQGPWTLNQINAYIRLAIEAKDLSSIEFILVQQAEEGSK